MANTYNMKGTSFSTFTIGKKGATLHQGTDAPVSGLGDDGDIYVQRGATSALWQKVSSTWEVIGTESAKIFTGTTSVDTNEVADTITINVVGNRIIDVQSGVSSVGGEKLSIASGNANITLSVTDTVGTSDTDLIVDLQAGGKLKIQSDADSLISTDDGSSITIQPGDRTDAAGGDVTISGGKTTGAGLSGGNILLSPGESGAGGALPQVWLPEGYVGFSSRSVVTKANSSTRIIAVVTDATYSLTGVEQVVLVNRTVAGATTVSLPASTNEGRKITIKDSKGDAATNNITINVTGGGTIDSTTSYTINANYGSVTVIWSGTAWFVI